MSAPSIIAESASLTALKEYAFGNRPTMISNISTVSRFQSDPAAHMHAAAMWR